VYGLQSEGPRWPCFFCLAKSSASDSIYELIRSAVAFTRSSQLRRARSCHSAKRIPRAPPLKEHRFVRFLRSALEAPNRQCLLQGHMRPHGQRRKARLKCRRGPCRIRSFRAFPSCANSRSSKRTSFFRRPRTAPPHLRGPRMPGTPHVMPAFKHRCGPQATCPVRCLCRSRRQFLRPLPPSGPPPAKSATHGTTTRSALPADSGLPPGSPLPHLHVPRQEQLPSPAAHSTPRPAACSTAESAVAGLPASTNFSRAGPPSVAPRFVPRPLRRHREPNPGRLREASSAITFPRPKSGSNFCGSFKYFAAELVSLAPSTFDVNGAATLFRHRTVFRPRIEFQLMRISGHGPSRFQLFGRELACIYDREGSARNRAELRLGKIGCRSDTAIPKKSVKKVRETFSAAAVQRHSNPAGLVSSGAPQKPGSRLSCSAACTLSTPFQNCAIAPDVHRRELIQCDEISAERSASCEQRRGGLIEGISSQFHADYPRWKHISTLGCLSTVKQEFPRFILHLNNEVSFPILFFLFASHIAILPVS